MLYFWIYHCYCKQRLCFGWSPYCKWTHQIHRDQHCKCKQRRIKCVLDGVLIVNGPTRCTYTMGSRDSISDSAILGASSPYFLRSSPSLSFDILDKRNINNQCSTSCFKTGPCHGIPDSLLCSCLSRMK
jgi:hypothetical protein